MLEYYYDCIIMWLLLLSSLCWSEEEKSIAHVSQQPGLLIIVSVTGGRTLSAFFLFYFLDDVRLI